MGKDIRALLDVLGDNLAESASNTYGSVIAAAFFIYLGILCMFIVILRKKTQPEEDNKKGIDVEMGQQK